MVSKSDFVERRTGQDLRGGGESRKTGRPRLADEMSGFSVRVPTSLHDALIAKVPAAITDPNGRRRGARSWRPIRSASSAAVRASTPIMSSHVGMAGRTIGGICGRIRTCFQGLDTDRCIRAQRSVRQPRPQTRGAQSAKRPSATGTAMASRTAIGARERVRACRGERRFWFSGAFPPVSVVLSHRQVSCDTR